MGEKHQLFLVESAVVETRLRLRHQLRVLWRRILEGYQLTNKDIIPLAKKLGVDPEWLTNQLTLFSTFGLLLELVKQCQQQTGKWAQHYFLVEIESAISELRVRLNYLRHSQQQHKYKCDRLHKQISPRAYTKLAQTSQADILTRADVLDAVV